MHEGTYGDFFRQEVLFSGGEGGLPRSTRSLAMRGVRRLTSSTASGFPSSTEKDRGEECQRSPIHRWRNVHI